MSNYLKIGAESTYGNGSSTLTGCLFSTIKETQNRNVMTEKTTDAWVPRTVIGGALGISGTLEANLRPLQMQPLFTALFGSLTTGDTEDTLVLDAPQSMQFSVGDTVGGNTEIDYVGVGITSCELTFNTKEFVTTNFSWLAKTYEPGTYAAPTYTTEDPVTFYTASINIDGVPSYKIKSMNMTIDRHINEDAFVLGDYTMQYLGATDNTDITGSFTILETDTSEETKAIEGALTDDSLGDIALVIDCKNLAGVTTMEFNLPVTVYTQYDKNSSGGSEIEKTLDYQVAYSDALKITYPHA